MAGVTVALAAYRARAAARVHSVNGEVCRRVQVHLIHRILMKQQNPIENQCVGGKCHRPLYICHYVLPFSTSNS